MSSHQKSKGLSLEKFASPLSKKTKSKTHLCGHHMCGSRIGSTSRDLQGKTLAHHSRMSVSSYILFCLTITFASTLTQFVVGSHNLHSYKKSSPFHKSCIENFGGIWLGQEHWLSEKNLSEFSSLGVQFVARSGMEDAISTGIYRGRPFGGVSIAWSSSLNHVIKPLVNYKHRRVVCIELNATPFSIILASVYMPYLNTSKQEECITDTLDAISMLESIATDHPNHHLIVGGDFNTEFNGNSPFDRLWREFVEKHNLRLCDYLHGNSNP